MSQNEWKGRVLSIVSYSDTDSDTQLHPHLRISSQLSYKSSGVEISTLCS